MNNAGVPASGRIARILRAFSCALALLTLLAGPAEAQLNPQQADYPAVDLQASFEQMKRENAALSADIKRLSEQLDALAESMRRVEGTIAAPPEAWWALGVVGFAR